MIMQPHDDETVLEDSRLQKVEKSVTWLRSLLISSVLLNAALAIIFLLIGGVNVFTRRITTHDILLQDNHGKVFGEIGVKKDWDDFSTGKYYPGIRFYDEAGKATMTTFGTGTSFSDGDESAQIGFTGVYVSDKNSHIVLNPSTFSFGNDSSIFLISPSDTGIGLSAASHGNKFGVVVDDKSASMYVADPKAEVDINAENGHPEINRILRNQNYVQPVR
jgi:hypothetical protein